MATAKKDIESKLLGDDHSIAELNQVGRELAESSHSVGDSYFDEAGNLTVMKPKNVLLTGEDAMKYLGLVPTKHNMLRYQDHARIDKRFRPFSTAEDSKENFWKHITFRVWKLDNLGKHTMNVRDKKSGELHEGGVYVGDVFDGRALEGFLPNVKKSDRYSEYKVQLVSINVTEDMNYYVQCPQLR